MLQLVQLTDEIRLRRRRREREVVEGYRETKWEREYSDEWELHGRPHHHHHRQRHRPHGRYDEVEREREVEVILDRNGYPVRHR